MFVPGLFSSTRSLDAWGKLRAGATPTDAAIEGVTVSVEWAVSSASAQATLTAQAYLGGSPYGSPLTNPVPPTTDLVQSFELTGLTRADLVSGTFEVEVRATRGSGGPAFTARLDAVTVTVEYTAGTQTYTFDNNGNQTAAGPTTFTYDYADRLKTATVGGTTETYTYAGDGVRLTASTGVQPNQTTKFLWDRTFGLPQLVIERDGSDNLLRSYRYGLDLVSQAAGANTYVYHHDGLGSVADVTSSTGSSGAWNEFYPYGQVRLAGVGAGAPAANPFNFTGEQFDTFSGLYHLRARQYDPVTGRFLSQDPLAPMLNDPYVARYVYAQSNPVRYVDPAGLEGEAFLDSLWDVAQFVVNAPWTAVAVTASLLTGSSCGFQDGLIVECYGNDLMPYGSAITIGNSVTTSYSAQRYRRVAGLREHENAHTAQWTIPGFPFFYGVGMFWSQLTTNDWFCGNPFERAAGPTPGYAYCRWGSGK